MQATTGNAAVIDLFATDWEGTRRAQLREVPRDTSVGQIVDEAARALQLPFASFFNAVFRGRELNHDDTLEELGVETDDQIQLVPEVSAG